MDKECENDARKDSGSILRLFGSIPVLSFFGVLIAVGIICAFQSEPPTPSRGEVIQPKEQLREASAGNAPDLKRGTEAAPFIVRLERTPAEEESAKKNERQADEKASLDRRQVQFNGLLVLVGILQVFLIAIQANITRGQHKTTKAELRAYVSTSIKRISHFDSQNAPTFDFEIINHGQTPAKNVEYRGIMGILPNDAVSIPDIQEGWHSRRMNLFPNANQASGDRGEIRCHCGRVFSQEEIAQFRARTHFIFIGLEIQYWDFVGDVGHITRNYYRVSSPSRAGLHILTFEGAEEVEVTGLSKEEKLPTFHVIPGLSLIT